MRSPARLVLFGALALIGLALLALDRIVPPWTVRLPLVPLAVPPSSIPVDAIPAEPGSGAGHSVLLITLDTVRPDRLGLHGNQGIATPNLDRLAREGVVFSEARATGSSTLPTHASILTGLYPHRHGALANGAYRLDDAVETLAQRLRRNGYATAAFVSAFVLDAKFGLARGFAVYDDDVSQGDPGFGYPERRADRTADRAIAWLERRRDRPFFLWVHLFDPHADYLPPPEYDRYPLAYDGEIAFVDAQVGRLIGVAGRAAGGRLVSVVTSDHGEAFGEQGEETHSVLLQEATVRVPLLLHAPGVIESGRFVGARVSQVDLVPTLLSVLGIPGPEPGADGSGFDGLDLTRAPDPGRAILAQTLEARVSFGWAPLTAVYQGPLKYVEGAQEELYDLAADPGARQDVASERPDELARLRSVLASLRPRSEAPPATHALSRDDAERLAALGYAEPAAAGAPGPGARPDPVRWMPLLAHLDRLAALSAQSIHPATRLSALREGIRLPARGEDVVPMIESIAEEHPDFAPVWLYLRDIYRRQGRAADSAEAARRYRALTGAGESDGR